MNHKAILIFILIIAGGNLFATHYRGGEIIYKSSGNYTLEATIVTYTKISYPANLADRDSITISWGDGTTSILPRINGANDSTCTGASPCGVKIGTDIKQSIYKGTHAYPGPPSNADYYIISCTEDNLLGGIANVDNGNSINIPFFIQDSVYMGGNYNAFPGGFDVSPVFLNPPKYYAFVGATYTFNSAAYDADGDSLAYALVTPRESPDYVVPVYMLPDSFCKQNGEPGSTFKLNPLTGQVTWTTPCVQGFFQFAVEVKQFRCGLFIGNVMRNMQIIVLPQPINPPVISAVHDTVLQPGQLLEFAITSNDSTAFEDSIQVLGGAFLDTLSSSRPVFNGTAGNPASGNFSWQPDTSFVTPTSYLFTVISTNNYTSTGPDGTDPYPASSTETFRVWVGDSISTCILSSVNSIASVDLQIRIFPNPASDILHIETPQQISNLLVSDLSGRKVLSQKPGSINYDLAINNLEDGVYLLSITSGDIVITRRFVKAE